MKKKLLSILLLIALLISFSAPLGMQAADKTIKLNKAKAVLEVDAKITLKLGDIVATDVKWSSSAKKIASVTSKGVVTAKSEGSATITAKHENKTYSCKITVVDSNKEQENSKSKGVKITKTYLLGNHYYIVLKNNREYAVDIDINLTMKNEKGEMVGYKSENEIAIPSENETIMEFYVDDSSAKKFDAEIKEEKTKYKEVIQNLYVETVKTKRKAIVTMKNVGDIDVEFPSVYVLFFKGSKLADVGEANFEGDSFATLESGLSDTKEVSTYEEFDSISIYISAANYF